MSTQSPDNELPPFNPDPGKLAWTAEDVEAAVVVRDLALEDVLDRLGVNDLSYEAKLRAIDRAYKAGEVPEDEAALLRLADLLA